MKKVFSLLLAVALVVSMSASLGMTAKAASYADVTAVSYDLNAKFSFSNVSVAISPFVADRIGNLGDVEISIGQYEVHVNAERMQNEGGKTVVHLKTSSLPIYVGTPAMRLIGTLHIVLKFYGTTFSGLTMNVGGTYQYSTSFTQRYTRNDLETNKILAPTCNHKLSVKGSQSFGYGSATVTISDSDYYRQTPISTRGIHMVLTQNNGYLVCKQEFPVLDAYPSGTMTVRVTRY
jgi:hypothetical protein